MHRSPGLHDDGRRRTLRPQVIRWLPTSLAVIALGLFLIAPAVNGPLLVLGWGIVLSLYRYIATAAPDRASRALVDAGFLVICTLAAFEGGWFLLPAGVAYLVRDLRPDRRGQSTRVSVA